MKKIYESDYVGFDENAEALIIYEFEDELEHVEFDEMSDGHLCDYFGFVCEEDYDEIQPGEMYHTYSFDISRSFLIIRATKAYNV